MIHMHLIHYIELLYILLNLAYNLFRIIYNHIYTNFLLYYIDNNKNSYY